MARLGHIQHGMDEFSDPWPRESRLGTRERVDKEEAVYKPAQKVSSNPEQHKFNQICTNTCRGVATRTTAASFEERFFPFARRGNERQKIQLFRGMLGLYKHLDCMCLAVSYPFLYMWVWLFLYMCLLNTYSSNR